MEDKVFQTRELTQLGDGPGYVVWFRLADGSRLVIEMSLGGLVQLQGLVNRSVERLGDAQTNEMNAHPISKATEAVV